MKRRPPRTSCKRVASPHEKQRETLSSLRLRVARFIGSIPQLPNKEQAFQDASRNPGARPLPTPSAT